MSSINAKVPPLRLFAVDTPSDGQLPAYQSSSGEFEWVDDSAGGSPGTPADAIQFNSDPAGTFTGDAGYVMSVIGGGASTVTQTGNILTGGNKIATATSDGTVNIISDGTGQIVLSSGNDQGGTWTDSIVNIMANANTDDAQLKFRDSANTDNGSITLDGSGDLVLNNNVANKDIDLKVLGTGIAEVANQTTDNSTTFSIKGNGTGDSVLQLTNASEAVSVVCDANNKLKIKGSLNDFEFDVSSATGGITWPDGTTQTTAASGVSFPLEATDGSQSAPSYTFASDTNTGLYWRDTDKMAITTGGSRRVSVYNTAMELENGCIILNTDGSAGNPAYSFDGDANTGIFSTGTDEIGFSTGGTERLAIGSSGEILVGGSAAGSDGQVLTSGGSGAAGAWEDAGGGGGPVGALGPAPADVYDGSYYALTGIQAGWGGNSITTSWVGGYPAYFPFISHETGDLASMTVKVTTAQTGGTAVFGIYSDSDGMPDSLQGTATISMAATGEITQTTLSTTITLSRGTQYWIGMTTSAGTPATVQGVAIAHATANTSPTLGINEDFDSTDCNMLAVDGFSSSTTLPASITGSDLIVFGREPPIVGLKW